MARRVEIFRWLTEDDRAVRPEQLQTRWPVAAAVFITTAVCAGETGLRPGTVVHNGRLRAGASCRAGATAISTDWRRRKICNQGATSRCQTTTSPGATPGTTSLRVLDIVESNACHLMAARGHP